jgi:hypothetical protein
MVHGIYIYICPYNYADIYVSLANGYLNINSAWAREKHVCIGDFL